MTMMLFSEAYTDDMSLCRCGAAQTEESRFRLIFQMMLRLILADVDDCGSGAGKQPGSLVSD